MFIHLWTQDIYDFQKISGMYSNLPTLFFSMFPFDPPKNFNKVFSGGGGGGRGSKRNIEKKRVNLCPVVRWTCFLQVSMTFF